MFYANWPKYACYIKVCNSVGLFKKYVRKGFFVTIILSLLIIFVSVYILAIITDGFFVISLDEIAARLEMPSDVAGASLMAVGSSAPELFIALFAVIQGGDHGSVGIGTIVGSAVFNILIITGASTIVAGTLDIGGGGVERDIIFYLGSISLLLFVFWDGQIFLWEAISLVVAYMFYIWVLWKWGENNPPDEVEKPDTVHEKMKGINGIIETVFGWIARDPHKNYVWAMIVSVLAIAGISFILVESAVALSNALGLPPLIVSMTLLAAGTSAPDLIASVGVAREGRGGMAVANAVGSNIFDVLIGLGLPWVLTLVFMSQAVEVSTEGLISSIFILSGTVIIAYIFLYTGRKLVRWEGWALVAVYVAYVVYAYITNT